MSVKKYMLFSQNFMKFWEMQKLLQNLTCVRKGDVGLLKVFSTIKLDFVYNRNEI